MNQMILNPRDGIYPATGDYVHGISLAGISRLIYISGTMGLEASGRPAPTLEGQLALIWENIRRILVEGGMGTNNIVRVTSYLVDASFAEANGAARAAALGNRRVPTTAIVVGMLSPDWLVEVEVIAAA